MLTWRCARAHGNRALSLPPNLVSFSSRTKFSPRTKFAGLVHWLIAGLPSRAKGVRFSRPAPPLRPDRLWVGCRVFQTWEPGSNPGRATMSRGYDRSRYQKIKRVRTLEVRNRQRAIQAAVAALKLERGCARCGYARCAAALQFHHRDGGEKEHDVSRMAAQGRSVLAIIKEIAKCECLCANCHAELHDGHCPVVQR